MYVIDCLSGKKIPVVIAKLTKKEISQIDKSNRFDFNWNAERIYDVYRLDAKNSNEPLGLMSLKNRSLDFALEIRLLAVTKENIGKNKLYERIAGCLIAWACKKAFTEGYGGYVCLKPKTELIDIYINKYGFESTRLFLITEGENSLRLIDKYYEN